MEPQTAYARLGDQRIAYQVLGTGPLDLVFTAGSYGSTDVMWEDAATDRFVRDLASFSRVIMFDRRGTGGSDPARGRGAPTWEAHAEELLAVMNAVGSARVAILALLDAGPMSVFFAATHPQRTSALILANTSARYLAADDYPIGVSREVADQLLAYIEHSWGTEVWAEMEVPSRSGDDRFRRWFAKALRVVASPAQAAAYYHASLEADARAILPSVHVPTLVLHRREYATIPISHGRYLAEHIAEAKFVELPGADSLLNWEASDLALDHIREFLTGARGRAPDRVLATVLFTDIVSSTETAARMGDRRWRELLDHHDDIARRHVGRWRGRVIKYTGDGILATFDGPGRGIECARSLRDALGALGIEMRAGLHTGEIEVRDDDIGGMAAHIAARVMAGAGAGEVLVSRTVRDLVVGSEIGFDDRGAHVLKGVEGSWQLFSIREGVAGSS